MLHTEAVRTPVAQKESGGLEYVLIEGSKSDRDAQRRQEFRNRIAFSKQGLLAEKIGEWYGGYEFIVHWLSSSFGANSVTRKTIFVTIVTHIKCFAYKESSTP